MSSRPRVVLVTGCTTGGIGYALCEEYAKQGCKVYATSRRIETIADFPSYSNALPIEKLALDVTSDESIAKAIEFVIEAQGRIDVLVNNAGTLAPGPILEQNMEDVMRVLNTNTVSILRVSKAVTPHMAEQRKGIIVNIGSIVGNISTPWNGVYSATKAAVARISESMAMELQPFNVQVVHVAPGAITSNVATNAQAIFSLKEGSLWAEYLPDMIRRIYASQGANSMPNALFAQRVVAKTLQSRLPFWTYLTLGGNATLFMILRWLPRGLVLRRMWSQYSKKK